ncbi:6-phospho-3-hexuloisomerase [Marinococcus luteus]|nr:6-phospho-3-hexuloisomerase [Marinococcus luteus]
MMNYYDSTNSIIDELSKSLNNINDEEVVNLFNEIQKADKVFFVGVGRVLLSLKSVAKRLAHLGVKTYIVGQVTEPAITKDDLLIVGSGSGESAFPLTIAKKAKQYGANVAHIGANKECSMQTYSDVFIKIPVSTKLQLPQEISSVQPMTSLFEQSLLLLGDTLALMMVKDQNIDMTELWEHHANLE